MDKKTPMWPLALLLAGNLIGSGLLALPICLGMAGIIPTILGLVVVWLLMTYTGFIIAGKVAKSKSHSFDLPSLFGEVLGQKVKWLAIIANAIVLYGLLVAYLAGSTSILAHIFNIHSSVFIITLIIFIAITALNIFGLKIVCRGNVIFMLLLFLTFLYLTFTTGSRIEISNFKYANWLFLLVALPVIVNAYNCHNVIPSVCKTLNFDLKRTKQAIFLGLTIGFVLNLSWCIATIGAMNFHGSNGILYAFKFNLPATIPLSQMFHSKIYTAMAGIFGLTAIFTSYITVGAALTAFLKDLRTTYTNIKQKYFDLIFAFIPPLIFTLIMPHVFLSAQDIIGGFGIALLFGVLPGFILLRAIKYTKTTKSKMIPAYGLILFFGLIIVFVLTKDFGLLSIPIPVA